MAQPADRNLLFGILALQMELIDRDQLVDGMHRWVTDKNRDLGDVLVAAGAARYELDSTQLSRRGLLRPL